MKPRMRLSSFLLSVQPWQGLLEAWLVGCLILGRTSHLEGYTDPFVFQTAMFFLCGSCGMWAVLRIRLPDGGWKKQTFWEFCVGLALSFMMVFALRLCGLFLHWDAIWRLTTWDEWQVLLLFGLTGPGYFFTRGGLRLWLRWNRMRKQRMRWSITHAHLLVALFIAFIFAFLAFLITPYSTTALRIWEKTRDPMASLLTGLLVTFFPALTLIVVGMGATLFFILPPSAVFSYFVARRTTRRLEALTVTTAALRSGDYQARVTVEGEDEVAHLQSDFNAMADKLSLTLMDLNEEKDRVAQILESKRELVANVSHELRTPVATLRAAIESMLTHWQETPSEELHRKVELMENEIQQLSGLIDDLFTLSQADVDHLALDCVRVDLHSLINQAVDSFSPLAWQSGRVEFTAQLPKELPFVNADPRRLNQVILNLLRNGVRHTPPGGIVAIQAEKVERYVQIDVRDTGEGIDPEDIGHIFERFYRGKNATSESAGLGLALVKELIEAMGGSITVESQPGQGSCFYVRIPAIA